ncbi:5-carboxymethyl-2-hydroxymuconate Delta-isomerase (plasmid) [halophilic archaeon DL31]|nr:5-carboxymethyl-2-hydroxymuconate Delta-isomerase [halophilic archaeon DL31]
MRKARFIDPAGTTRTGEWTDGEIVTDTGTYDPDEVRLLAPSDPSKIICVGLNYHDHVEEGSYDEIPEIPMLFLKPPNTVSAHGDTVTLPEGKYCEHEAEFAVVIGEQCRAVSADDVMDVVAGFTCSNDVSNRDDQYMEMERNWNFVRGKAFDNAAPMGPVLATPDEVPEDAAIELRVNGETRQSSSRDDMIFSVPEVVEEVTKYITLEPGDVIMTGTPAGVDEIADGDTVEIEIEGIGTLRHGVETP